MKIFRIAMVLLLALQAAGILMLERVYHILHGGPAWDATPEARLAGIIWVAAILAAWAVSIVYIVLILLKKAPRDKWMALLIAATILPYVWLYVTISRSGGGI